MVICGDSLEALKTLEPNSVDAVVTDPPYGLSFMGKQWDYDVPQVELWQEVYRVLKPGGHLLSFAGTRTQHRMAVNIEDAGFEIRDMIAWVYGSGFPKSLNIGKAVDKVIERIDMFEPFAKHYETQRKLKGLTHNQICESGKFYENHNHGGASSNWSTGASVPTKSQYEILKPLLELSDEFDGLIERIEREREVIGKQNANEYKYAPGVGGTPERTELSITKGNSPWEGWGTALKPALEPITVARKPLSEKTVAENCLKWGVGGINIDGCRVDFISEEDRKESTTKNQHEDFGTKPMTNNNVYGDYSMVKPKNFNPPGRFPANLIHDGSDEVVGLFPQTGGAKNAKVGSGSGINAKQSGASEWTIGGKVTIRHNDGGGSAARFFYCAKSSKSERNAGLEGFEVKASGSLNFRNPSASGRSEDAPSVEAMGGLTAPKANHHPTVKPVKLMQYLVKLVTPKGGTVLDPFTGSGTTGIACKLEGFEFIGIEREQEYVDIANARIEAWEEPKQESLL